MSEVEGPEEDAHAVQDVEPMHLTGDLPYRGTSLIFALPYRCNFSLQGYLAHHYKGTSFIAKSSLQGYFTYKKTHPPRTLPQAYA